jgi:two-component system LytT family sensor kinase
MNTKSICCLILLLTLAISVFAQRKDDFTRDEKGNPQHYTITGTSRSKGVMLTVDKATTWISPFNSMTGDQSTRFVFLSGTKQIKLETKIHKDSIKYYRYSIIENDNRYIVDDAIPNKINFIWNERSDFPGFVTVNLGTFGIQGKKIAVEIYKLPFRNRMSRAIIFNREIQPAKIVDVLITEPLSGKKIKDGRPKLKRIFDGDTILNSEPSRIISLNMKSTDMNFIYNVILSRGIGKYTETVLSTNQWANSYKGRASLLISPLYFKKPGIYHVTINPIVFKGYGQKNTVKQTTFNFVVVEKGKKTFQTKEIILVGLIAAAVFGAIFGASIAYIKKKNQKKLFLSQQQKEISKAQLNSIRSQLNPHFMFNALAGIQNLMNQNKIDEANRYLGKFARLTRNVLDQNELISLAEEKELLEDYLQMEQLRFGFTYEIEIDRLIDLNIEIPSMLLQPFVENAVKHGIASEAANGNIKLYFKQQNKNLVLSIKDNGVGFATDQTYSGLGLQLSKNRISLLNSIYTETPFILEIKSDPNGTTINIILTQWL